MLQPPLETHLANQEGEGGTVLKLLLQVLNCYLARLLFLSVLTRIITIKQAIENVIHTILLVYYRKYEYHCYSSDKNNQRDIEYYIVFGILIFHLSKLKLIFGYVDKVSQLVASSV